MSSLRWSALVVLCCLTFLIGLDRQAITDSDEAFYAEAGREMVAGGDWVTPHYNFDARLQKPILYYWMVAATYGLVGAGEAPARFWSAMSGLGLALLAAGVARRWFGAGPGLLAGAIAATSFGVTVLTRMALPDGPLAFFVTLSIWSAFEALGLAPVPVSTDRGGRKPRWSRRAWLLLSALSLALGALTKGPVAVVLVLLVVAPAVFWERRRAGGQATDDARPIRMRDAVAALALFALVTVPWFVAVTHAQGAGYLRQFFVGENIDRFATTQNNDVRPLWFYGPVVLGGLLPWSPLAILWLQPAVRVLARTRRLSMLEVRLAAWALAPLVFFSISIGKQPRYVLPCLAPLAVLLGRSIWTRLEHHRTAGLPADRLLATAGMLSGTLLAVLGMLMLRVSPILTAADPDWTRAGSIAVVVAGLAVVASALVRQGRALPLTLTLASAVAGFVLQASVFAQGRPEPVELAAASMLVDGQPSTTCACGAFTRNLNFYTHAKTVVGDPTSEIERFLSSPDRVTAAVDSKALAALEAKWGRRLPRLLEVPYLNVAALRMGDLVDPDPSRVLQRVVVVANR
jgi:4-amino-4-deoxy-L-arabinose transferase-like glycosyltransferase